VLPVVVLVQVVEIVLGLAVHSLKVVRCPVEQLEDSLPQHHLYIHILQVGR